MEQKKQRWWKRLLFSLDGFILIIFIAIDIVFRVFEEYIIETFSGLFTTSNMRLILICIVAGMWILKKSIQIGIQSARKGDNKMLKFLKRLFSREYRKYKKLLKETKVKNAVKELLERFLIELEGRKKMAAFIDKATDMLKDRHMQECENLARQLYSQSGESI